jgi:hypothetical protein
MKSMKSGIIIALLLILKQHASAQGFVNLNFESANIPNGTSPGSLISISDGMPGWSAYFVSSGATNQTTQVAYEGISLGGVAVSIVDTNVGFGFNPIQGKYSAFLFGGVGNDNQPYSAQVSQTGFVPSGTESIQFDALLSYGPAFIVALGGQTISMSPLQTFAGYTLYGGNIPTYLAGESATLSITEPPPSGTPPSILELDNIQFSTSSIPEPRNLGVLALCSIFFTWLWQRKTKQNKQL